MKSLPRRGFVAGEHGRQAEFARPESLVLRCDALLAIGDERPVGVFRCVTARRYVLALGPACDRANNDNKEAQTHRYLAHRYTTPARPTFFVLYSAPQIISEVSGSRSSKKIQIASCSNLPEVWLIALALPVR